MGTAATPAANAAQLNQMARAAIKARAIKMTQVIFNQTFTPAAGQNISASNPQITVPLRNVGLIMGFWLKVVFTVNNGSAETIDLTDFGPANVFSQIQFTDLNNNIRIQTPGWHIAFVNAIKARQPFGAASLKTSQDSPINFGSNFTGVTTAAATITAGNNSTLTMWYYVPLAYSENDFRGAIYANVVNATMQLVLTPNPTPVVQYGTDSTSAVYVGAAAGSMAAAVISSMTVEVYQEYLDQLPVGKGGVLLPMMDLSTLYELKQTNFSAITATQDFPMQYANFRDFISTTLVYVNTGATGARTGGTDMNYLALQAANMTNLFKIEPALAAIKVRNHLGYDLPPGVYYFGSREKPISTIQYGNMELIINAITAGAGAYALVGYEDFARVQALNQAGSLAAS